MMSMGREDSESSTMRVKMPAMGVEREVLGLEIFGGFVERVIVEQNGAEDRALGFDVRRHASDGGVDGWHLLFSSSRLHSMNQNRNLFFVCAVL